MDGSQFDDISRKFAGRSTRRDAVRTGGLLAAVAGAFGLRSSVQAQTDDKVIECEWAFKALIIEGPNKDATYEGLMKVNIEKDGAIDKATLETDAPKPYKVVGNTRGKAISLRVTISSDLSVACTGVGSRDVKSCQGQIDGTLAGPEFGDIGVWQIVRRVVPGGNSTATAEATATAVVEVPTNAPPPPATNTPAPQPTATTCPEQQCPVSRMWDPVQCMCVCYDNGIICGDICCPATMICTSPGTGECGCTPDQEACNAACFDLCPSGQSRDLGTCGCI